MPASWVAGSATNCDGQQLVGEHDRLVGEWTQPCSPCEREQDLRREIVEIIDAFVHPRIVNGPECSDTFVHGQPPGESRALAARDRTSARSINVVSSRKARWAVSTPCVEL